MMPLDTTESPQPPLHLKSEDFHAAVASCVCDPSSICTEVHLGCSRRDEDDPKMMQPKLSHPSRRETYSISRWLSARAHCHAPKGLVSHSSRRAPVCLDCSHLRESAGRDYRALLHRRVRRGLPSFPNLATRFFHGFVFPSKTLNRPLVISLSREAQSRCASRGATLRGESHTSRPRLSGDFVARVAEAS